MRAEEIFSEVCTAVGIEVNGSKPWDIQVHDGRFFSRVIADGSLGLGETYVLGWWDCDDLLGFLNRLLTSPEAAKREHVGFRTTVAFLRARLTNLQSIKQTQHLAAAHYDLSNPMFEQMLGKSMAYSCGLWNGAQSLDEAQQNKLETVCEKLRLQKGESVLDKARGQ